MDAFHTCGVSRTGRRPSNEDTAAWDVFANGPMAAFALVCDGMGGHNAGEVASALAVEHLEQRLRELSATGVPDGAQLEALVRASIDEANALILERGQKVLEQRGMGTTMALALATRDRRLLVANIGDSRIFLVRGLTVEQLSVDHTALAEQRRALGFDLSMPEDTFANPFAHALTRSLGQELRVEPDVRCDLELRPGDLVVLTSDGVTDVLEAERLLAAVEASQGLDEVAEEIYRQAFESGSRDNITVALLGYGLPGRLGAGGNGEEPERDTVSGTLPLWRSPSGGVKRVMPPAPHEKPAPATDALVLSPLRAAALGVGLFAAGLSISYGVYRLGAPHEAPPSGSVPAAEAVPPPPTTAPLPVASAAIDDAKVEPTGEAWLLKLRFKQRVSSQSSELALSRERLTASGRALVASGDAELRLPCDGFDSVVGTYQVACRLPIDAATPPKEGETVALSGVLGDGLRIDLMAKVMPVRAP